MEGIQGLGNSMGLEEKMAGRIAGEGTANGITKTDMAPGTEAATKADTAAKTKAAVEVNKEAPVQGEQDMGIAAEYISSEKAGQRPSGLYSVEKDAEGKTSIRYDDPRKAKQVSGEPAAADKELNNLKNQRDKLKLQIKKEAGSRTKVEMLKKKLAAIEKKIKQHAR